jgi:hypothetical protein
MRSAYDLPIASLYDLCELRAGRHVLRDEDGWRSAELWLESTWLAVVRPSFHPPALVACAQASEWTENGDLESVWRKAAFAVVDRADAVVDPRAVAEAAIAPVDADPIRDAVSRIEFMTSTAHMSVDGIRYEFESDTLGCAARIDFASPVRKDLVNLERGLFDTASLVAAEAESPKLDSYLEAWAGYMEARAS